MEILVRNMPVLCYEEREQFLKNNLTHKLLTVVVRTTLVLLVEHSFGE